MRSKGRGSDDGGRGRTDGEGRGWRARRRAAEHPEPGTPADPWDDDQWDDGWSDRAPGRPAAGPRPQQVDAWLESDPDGGEITRDIAQRWTGATIPPPGGTWVDDPVETWSDDEQAERVATPTPARPAPRPTPPPAFESLDEEPEPEPEPEPARAPARRTEPAVPTSLFAAPPEEDTDLAPWAEPAAGAPAFDTHPFEEADTFAAEPPPATRVTTEPSFRPAWPDEPGGTRGPTAPVHPAAVPAATFGTIGLSPTTRRTARLVGTACVAVAALRVLLTLAAVAGTIEGGVFLDRLAALDGMHGTAYALSLALGAALLAVARSDDEEAPAVALGVALTTALAMLVGAVLSVRLDLRALDDAGTDLDLAALTRIGSDAVGSVGLTIAAAWAALRAADR